MIGDTSKRQEKWEFNIFWNTFVKDEGSGIWKVKRLDITRLIHAPYPDGWGKAGILESKADTIEPPGVLSQEWRSRPVLDDYQPPSTSSFNSTEAIFEDLQNRYGQSAHL